MIELTCEQGSHEWFTARLGIPTASRFEVIVTGTGKASASQARQTYMMELLGERIGQTIQDTRVTAAMERGTALEPRARDWYALQAGADVRQVGFVMDDSKRWGCSPDGLVGEDGGIEIKCPTRAIMIAHLLSEGVPTCYLSQIQACMWVCGRAWWDFVLYTEDANVPSDVRRVDADPKMHAAFAEALPKFCDELDALEVQLRERYGLREQGNAGNPAWLQWEGDK